jgi:hypothetical protein
VNDLPFSTLLYRYFFFDWLFRIPTGDDRFEKGLAKQHNRRQARWLPVYMLRWLWLGLAFYALGGIAEIVFDAMEGSRWLYAFSAGCLSYIVPIGMAWVHLTQKTETSKD